MARMCSNECIIENDTKIQCFSCCLYYHLACYKIDPSHVNSIGGALNIQFVCDKCMIKANSDKTAKHPTLSSTFSELLIVKQTVNEILSSVKATENVVVKGAPTSAQSNSLQSPIANRRPTNQFGNTSFPVFRPKPKIPVNFGTCVDNVSELGRPVERKSTQSSHLKVPKFSKHIFVTNLDPHLTTEKVLDYIKGRGVDTSESTMDCIKLVKRGQSLDELTFCSFKISTNDEQFQMLMNASFWPSSVGYREFDTTLSNKRPAATLSPSLSPETNSAHSPKQFRSDASVVNATPKGNRQASRPIVTPNRSQDIRNFVK